MAGGGAPAAQVKLEGVNLTLSTSAPTRTNYVFKNWDTDPDADPFDTSATSYDKGDTYSVDAPLDLYAIWYPPNTVSYNSNGGAGTPSAQTKIYGNNISLSASVPTRFGYRFEGWNTEPDGSGTDYASGSTYSANADVTMYAVWSPIVSAVNIGTATVIRVETASSTTEDDDGEYGYITVPFVVTGAASASVSISITGEADGLYPDPSITYLDGPFTKQSGVDNVLSGTFHAVASVCDVECKYDFSITVTAHNTEAGVTQTDVSNIAGCIMPIAYLTMDVNAGGHGISFGAPATDDSFNVSMPLSSFHERIYQTFSRVSWSEASDQTTLPTTPCFVFDSSSYKAYWCDGASISQIGYLPLSGGTMTGGIHMNNDPIDRDGANPSSTQYGQNMVIYVDKDGELIGYVQPKHMADGRIGLQLTAVNENSSGNNVYNIISLYIDKNGTPTYGLSSPFNFCSALHVGDYYYKDNISGTSVASSASGITTIASISVPPGFYIVRFAANFASNASGFRAIGIGKGSTTPVWRYTGVQVAPLSGAKTYLVTSNFSNCTDNPTTFYGVVQQNSGSALVVQGIIEAIRIK